jgi:P-type Mg2+ transporter
MDVLCTDKTGTLTEGVIILDGAYDGSGSKSATVLRLASLNAALQTGLLNPIDGAILETAAPDLNECCKLGEIPFDFVRKRLSVCNGVNTARASLLSLCEPSKKNLHTVVMTNA